MPFSEEINSAFFTWLTKKKELRYSLYEVVKDKTPKLQK